ncbi:hypothetical protein HHS_06040 [Candidatus Pantoea carbekii]|uniref:Uncharacterized protein n=1 Tax=Candidatus Pantoea carbekii TaxID=1235990 RepID=U3U8A3_9GAMM|nr:hypothetical protein HHS_06040 [Candidatus Pantoea carbekii]
MAINTKLSTHKTISNITNVSNPAHIEGFEKNSINDSLQKSRAKQTGLNSTMRQPPLTNNNTTDNITA